MATTVVCSSYIVPTFSSKSTEVFKVPHMVHSQAFRIIIRYSRRVRPAHITLEGAMQLCMYVITFYYDKLSNRIEHKLLQLVLNPLLT